MDEFLQTKATFPLQYVFRINNATSENSVTTHEVLATAVTVILKQTADINTCNKLLKVTKVYATLSMHSRWRCWVIFCSRESLQMFNVWVNYLELVGGFQGTIIIIIHTQEPVYFIYYALILCIFHSLYPRSLIWFWHRHILWSQGDSWILFSAEL